MSYRNHARYEMVNYEQPDTADAGVRDSMSTASTIGHLPSYQPPGDFSGNGSYDDPRQSYKQTQPVFHTYDDVKNKEVNRNDTGFTSSLNRRLTFASNESATVHFLRDWWLELISVIFLIGALVAIIITAHEFQDHTLPNLPHGLSINSVFAIFIVILKAAMLLILAQGLSHLKWTWFKQSRPLNDLARYDNASRGPLGSLWLLFVLRGRDLIASVGAILIVAAVILDPMAQQVIRYYNSEQAMPNVNATLPRTNAFSERGNHATAGLSSVTTTLQSAINGGLFVPGARVGFGCGTGNCSFPEDHYTVGFVSNCVDVSEELKFENITLTYQTTIAQYDSAGNIQQVPITQNTTWLNATLPSGLSTSYNMYSQGVRLMTMGLNTTLNNSIEVILGPNILNPQDPHTPYCSSPEYDNIDKSTNWDCRGWGAARCTINPAVLKIASANVTAGRLVEEVTPEIRLDNLEGVSAGLMPSVVDVSSLSQSQKTALTALGYDLVSSPKWLPYNISMDLDGNLTSSSANTTNATLNIVPKESIYQVYAITTNSLNNFFATYFSGSIVPDGTSYTGPTVLQQFYNNRGITFDSVTSIFANISSSLTTYVRQNGDLHNSAPALGQVFHTETRIRVRWPLIAYPAALTALTILFFVLMVLQTSRAQQGVHHDFKSSPLALLFHGLEDRVQRRLETKHVGESNEVGDLSAEAKGMWVRLRPTGKGWRFVAADSQIG